jgi:glycosyltransferase involved in cell wall biosynthesis
MKENTIAIATFGDPRNPKTWSGTPAPIIKALEGLGLKVEGIDISVLPMAERFVFCAAFHLWRLNLRSFGEWIALVKTEARSDFNLMRTVRNRRARYLVKQMQSRGLRRVLHMVPYSIPVGGSGDSDIEHYLLIDGSAHLEAETLGPVQRPDHISRALIETEREIFSRVKHFFPASEHLRRDLVEFYGVDPSRITKIGTGASLPPFAGTKDYRSGHILFTAKARFQEKGGMLLLKAFQIAHRKNPALRLVMVGKESHRKAVGEMDGVTFHGFVPAAELEELFQRAALFAMPALVEPWGLVYLEALASKTPILGLRRLSLPELTDSGRFGFLVDEATPEAVAEVLLEAMSDPQRLQQMGEQGQAWSLKKYSWEIAGARIFEGLGSQNSRTGELSKISH